jgi:hypothetical protein
MEFFGKFKSLKLFAEMCDCRREYKKKSDRVKSWELAGR